MKIINQQASPALARPPLIPKNNMQQPPVIPLRRKSTFHKRRIADSSELSPSPHSSIFEAYHISPATSEETERKEENENRKAPRPVRERSLFQYGRGTALETIIEKKSNMTMSTLARTRSADDLSSFISVQQQQERDAAKLRRKQSFSVDDLVLINRSYPSARKALSSDDATEIYAQPRIPLQAPPERPGTPPGMPSWTAAQVIRSRQVSDGRLRLGSRFQRFFGVATVQPGPADSTHQVPAGRRVPRFRPPRSVYSNIDAHPFTVATMVKPQQPIGLPPPTGLRRPGHNLRSTPTAGDSSELLSFHTAPEHRRMSMRNSANRFRQCPHRKGRLAQLRALNNHEAQAVSSSQTSSPSRRSAMTVNGNTPSASTDRLMSGALVAPQPPIKCWKCKFETAGERIDRCWLGSAMFLCYVCCGVEFDEDDATENRRRILENTPVVNG